MRYILTNLILHLHAITAKKMISLRTLYIQIQKRFIKYDDVDYDVYLEYYSGKGFHINYSCLHVLRKTHKLVQKGISSEHKKLKHAVALKSLSLKNLSIQYQNELCLYI
jgi:hypothetical protein